MPKSPSIRTRHGHISTAACPRARIFGHSSTGGAAGDGRAGSSGPAKFSHAYSAGKLLPDATFFARRGRFPLWRRILGFSHGINSAIAQAKRRRLEKRRARTEGETEEAKVAIRWYFMYSYLWYCCFCLRLLSIPHGCVICRLQPRCGRRGESTRSQRAQASCGVVVI